MVGRHLSVAVFALAVFIGGGAEAQTSDMSFFVTSVGLGNGADLGGLAGAGAKSWRAYLSTQPVGGAAAATASARAPGRMPRVSSSPRIWRSCTATTS
jgi:hypothetical protein